MKFISNEIMMKKLKNLRTNLSKNTSKTCSLILSLNEAYEDRRKFVMNYYAENNAPTKTSALDITDVQSKDMTGMMIDFSINYEHYFSELESQIKKLSVERDDALLVFQEILRLPTNYSRTLYFMYVKGYSVEECLSKLYVSRATFYRYKTTGVSMLCDYYEKALMREIA